MRPDTAQWVDLRGILLSGRCDVHANGDPSSGFVVVSRDFPAAFTAGAPGRGVVLAATATATRFADDEEWHLLAPPESVESVAAALPGWQRRGVTLHTRLRETSAEFSGDLPDGIDIRIAALGWEADGLDIGHLPPALLREYRTPWVRRRPLAAALDHGTAVSFCYAAVATEGLWDVAVDTLESRRRQGLAAACFSALEDHLGERGLRPVWGALDDNVASTSLAARLGFEPVARLASFVRPLGGLAAAP